MKKFFSLITIGLVFLLAQFSYAQDFEVPENYKFQKPEDYKTYEPEILKAINYLENTSMSGNDAKIMDVNKFLMTWLQGSPNVKIILRAYVMDYCNENKEFLMIFMGGWTKYTLENKGDTDELKGSLAGMKSLIKVYKAGKGIEEDNNVDKLIKLEEEGKLESWLKDEIQKDNENQKS
jgi:signal-transduction protein with cAMP-binding, CBS, and nucleotidyltransferase domain